MHGHGRDTERTRQPFGKRGTNEQCPGKPRALRVGDGIDVGQSPAAIRKHLAQEGDGPPNVITRGELGDDTTVLAMHQDLRMESMGKQRTTVVGAVKRDPCFVTGRFDSENKHGVHFTSPVQTQPCIAGSAGRQARTESQATRICLCICCFGG